MFSDAFATRIRLRHLRCFVAVAQENSLAKAAHKLRLSESAISKTLSDLESIVAARLFERGRRGARLTVDGDAFRPHAIAALEALASAHGSLVAAHAETPETVRIGALPTVAPDLIAPVLGALLRSNPRARVEIGTATNAPLLRMLSAGEFDFVLGRMAEPESMHGLSFELLYAEPLALVARPRHRLARQARVTLAEVLAFPLVVPPRGTIPRHQIESLLHPLALKLPAACVETLSVSVGRRIALESDAIWFTPAGAARDDVDRRLLCSLAVPTAGSEEPVGLLRRNDYALAAAAAECVRLLREAASSRRTPAAATAV